MRSTRLGSKPPSSLTIAENVAESTNGRRTPSSPWPEEDANTEELPNHFMAAIKAQEGNTELPQQKLKVTERCKTITAVTKEDLTFDLTHQA